MLTCKTMLVREAKWSELQPTQAAHWPPCELWLHLLCSKLEELAVDSRNRVWSYSVCSSCVPTWMRTQIISKEHCRLLSQWLSANEYLQMVDRHWQWPQAHAYVYRHIDMCIDTRGYGEDCCTLMNGGCGQSCWNYQLEYKAHILT